MKDREEGARDAHTRRRKKPKRRRRTARGNKRKTFQEKKKSGRSIDMKSRRRRTDNTFWYDIAQDSYLDVFVVIIQLKEG